MRTESSAVSLVAVLGLSIIASGCTGAGTSPAAAVPAVSVPPSAISGLPAGTTFDIDLTQGGKVYRFEGPDTDFSRVTLKTAAGARNFGELLKDSNTGVARAVTLGRPGDMRGHLTVKSAGTTHFDCGVVCKCDDLTDCVDLILSEKCADEMWCSAETEACFCVAKAA